MRPRIFLLVALLASCGGGHAAPDAGDASDASTPAGPPSIVATAPADGATEIQPGAAIAIRFSAAMDEASVDFALTPSATLDPPAWDAVGASVALTATGGLAAGTAYTVSVTGKGAAGDPLTGATSFSFTTAAAPPAEDPPTVAAVIAPVTLDDPLLVQFSKPMDPRTVVVTATPDHYLQTPIWLSGLREARFAHPDGIEWLSSTVITVNVAGNDFAGNPLAGTTQFTFQTADPPAVVPQVLVTFPPAGAVNVDPNIRFSIAFDQPMDTAVTGQAFGIFPPVQCELLNPIRPPIWLDDGHTVYCRGKLAPSTSYTVTINGASDPEANYHATSRVGVLMPTTRTYTFTTGPAIADSIAPAIASLTPTAGATGVPLTNHVIRVGFTEPMDPLSGTFAASGATLRQSGWSVDRQTAFFDLTSDFAPGQVVSYTLTGFKDQAGNTLPTASETFTAIGGAAITAPADPARDGTDRRPGGVDATAANLTIGVSGPPAAQTNARAFLSFTLPPAVLAAGVVIERAWLVFDQTAASLEPLDAAQPARVLDVSLGSALDDADYDVAPASSAESDETIDNTTVGMHAVDVTAMVARDVQAGDHADLRIQYAHEAGDSGVTDAIATLGAGESADPPTLWISYLGGTP